jgi:hypothetical protein
MGLTGWFAPCQSWFAEHRFLIAEEPTMPLSGKDVWKAMVRVGLTSGPYDPETDRCANADRIAGRLNHVLRERKSNWLPKVMQTKDAMGSWEASTTRE